MNEKNFGYSNRSFFKLNHLCVDLHYINENFQLHDVQVSLFEFVRHTSYIGTFESIDYVIFLLVMNVDLLCGIHHRARIELSRKPPHLISYQSYYITLEDMREENDMKRFLIQVYDCLLGMDQICNSTIYIQRDIL